VRVSLLGVVQHIVIAAEPLPTTRCTSARPAARHLEASRIWSLADDDALECIAQQPSLP
jgi:hypothetical protein